MNHTSRNYFWLIVVLSLLLFFPGLGKTPLWIFDEVRNAECAREMYERGDWIVPTFNGTLRTMKPPLHYYFMFGGFQLFGITEWGARFFSAVFGVFTILLAYFFVKKYGNPLLAFITCLILLASTHFLFEFRMSVPDPYLIFMNVASVFTAFAWFREKKFTWLLFCAISMGLGTLAKGPVAIALPGLSVFLWLAWERKLKEVFSWKIALAGIIMIVVAFPWYWLVHQATQGEWTKGFFLQHNLGRFSEPMEGHGGLFILVPLMAFIGLLPSSVFAAETFKNFNNRFSHPLMRLAFCVTIAYLVFYSISSTKLPNYAMPCYPFIALLLGSYISQAWMENKSRRYPFFILLAVLLALPAAAYWGLKKEVNTNGMEYLSALLLLLVLAAVIALYFAGKKNFRKAALSIFFLYTFFHILFFNWLYPAVYSQNPMSKTIGMVKEYENVVGYQIFHPSFTFYLPQRIPVFHNLDSLKNYLNQTHAVVISRQTFAPELKSIGLTEKAAVHDLFEGNTTVLYEQRK
jgi:4-amino-4-deoxy-L-arabinose transferase-like glycosyltransferase